MPETAVDTGPHIGPEPPWWRRAAEAVTRGSANTLAHQIDAATTFAKDIGGFAESTARMAVNPATAAAEMTDAEVNRLFNLGVQGPPPGQNRSALEWVPLVGPVAADTANAIREGRPGRAVGHVAAVVAPMAAEAGLTRGVAAYRAGAPARAASARAGQVADFVKKYKQAHPPSPGHAYTDAELTATMPALADEHRAATITTTPDTIAAQTQAVGKIEENVRGLVDAFPNETVQVSMPDIEHALDTGAPGPRTPGSRGMGTRSTDVATGLKAIETLGLDQPMSLSELYDRVLRLNAELAKELAQSKYDVAKMRTADPEFRALELAADHARNLVWDRLDQLGVKGVRQLREIEAALIKTRGAALRHEFAGETMVRQPGGDSVGRRIVARMLKTAGLGTGALVGGAVAGGPGAVGGAAVGGELGEVAAGAVRGAQPRNVIVERAMRNLDDIPGMQFPSLPATSSTTPGGAVPGGPGGPAAGGPPGTGVGPAFWRPGPKPTVTILPPDQLPSGTAPLGLPPARPRQLGPAVRPMPSGAEAPDYQAPPIPPQPLPRTWAEVKALHGIDPETTATPQLLLGPAVREMPAAPTGQDYRAPRIAPQPLPTTWEETGRFHGGDPDLRGTDQRPDYIREILSLPPEEQALAIAELERGTPPPEPPAGAPPPSSGPPPAPQGPVGPLPAPVVAEPPTLPAPAEAPPPPPASTVAPLLPPEKIPSTSGDLVAQVQSSLMNNGSSDRGMDYWRQQFAQATPEALQATATYLQGPTASSWLKRFMLPEVMQVLRDRRAQPSLPGAEDVRGQEVTQPTLDIPEQSFNLSSPDETQPSQPMLGDEPPPAPGARQIAANVSEVDPRSIKVDPDRFQFKSNFDRVGVVPESRIKGKWNENLSGILLTWIDPVDGQRYVINGHNRLEAAVSKNVPRVIIRDVVATDAAEARAYGAMANIAENNGSPVDAAKVLRHATDPVAKLKELGIDTTKRLARDGLALAHLSDPLFQRVATGDLNEALGITIGGADLSPENQMAVVQLVERQAKKGKKLTPEVVAHLIEDVRDSPTVAHASEQGNMFADLLGEDRSQSVAIERAQIRDWLQTTLEKDKRLFKYVQQGDRAARLAAEGNVINAQANVAKAQESATIAELVKKLANAKGPINDAITTAAVRTANGEDISAIRAKLLEQVKRALEFELGGGAGPQ
jgi:hypothetical protein